MADKKAQYETMIALMRAANDQNVEAAKQRLRESSPENVSSFVEWFSREHDDPRTQAVCDFAAIGFYHVFDQLYGKAPDHA